VFYEVSNSVLMRAVNRNPGKFTLESMFRLNSRERAALPSLNIMKKSELVFTELGVSMLATVLKSPKAIAVHIQIIRETVQLMKTVSDISAAAR